MATPSRNSVSSADGAGLAAVEPLTESNVAKIPHILPHERVFPIQIGSELFKLSGASLSSDGAFFQHAPGTTALLLMHASCQLRRTSPSTSSVSSKPPRKRARTLLRHRFGRCTSTATRGRFMTSRCISRATMSRRGTGHTLCDSLLMRSSTVVRKHHPLHTSSLSIGASTNEYCRST